MTLDELAQRHPHLFHLTYPDAVDGIRRHGLLSPLALLALFEAHEATRARVLARRAGSMPLDHSHHGRAVVNDNRPLSDARLARILDNGLSPDDWRRMLAERVFLWTNQSDLGLLADARLNCLRPRAVLVFGTLSLACAHAYRLEISPINSGATIHQPPRWGMSTYASLLDTDWDEWRRRRGRRSPDRIEEVTVRGPVADAARHLLDIRHAPVA